MKRIAILGVISGLFVLVILLQPPALWASLQQQLSRQQQSDDRFVPAETAGSAPVFLPLIKTPPDPPDFEIISPENGWTVSGMMFVAAQARDPLTVSSITFSAGSTTLGTDNTPSDGFKVFFDASTYPAGNLTLTAVADGPSGQTSKSITVNVVPDPPSSATIGAQGGVLDTEIGSIITIPPGALPDGTQVSADELTQQEVTVQNGIDWAALGVTFLGAQEIQTTNPSSLPYRWASAGFGNRVQPGQAVVNYQIMPDADGDGVDEIVVVNTASVAPNNDVISDPIPQVLLADVSVGSNSANSGGRGPSIVSGPPGAVLEVRVTGLNVFSAFGNVAEWTCANGQLITVPGSVSASSSNPQVQIFLSVIPLCTPGPAVVLLKNQSTGATVGPFTIQVTVPAPLVGPPGTGTLNFLQETRRTVESIPDTLTPPSQPADWKRHALADIDNAEQEIQNMMANPTPGNQQLLGDSDTLLPEPEEPFPMPDPNSDCLTRESKEAIRQQIVSYGNTLDKYQEEGETDLAEDTFNTMANLYQMLELPDCEEPPDDPPMCEPAPMVGDVTGIIGGGSAPPPGGNGCGNVVGAGGGTNPLVREAGGHTAQGTGGVIIKIFLESSPIPFSGVADPGGYFFIPLIPAGTPFTAVAYDQTTGETRALQGVGPEPGKSVPLFFNFLREPDTLDAVTWDGGGDGTSWHDPLNWSTDAIPGPADDVIIDMPGAITVTHSMGSHAVLSLHSQEALVINGGTLDIGQASILSHTLTLNNGTLTGVGTVNVGGQLTWTNGVMLGTGVTRANGGLVLSGNNVRFLNGRTLENNGTALFQEGSFTAFNGATITNLAGATFDFQADVPLNVTAGGATFNNLGTVTKSAGSGTATIATAFNNSGTVAVASGTLRLTGNGSHSGTFQGTGLLQFAGVGNHTLSGSITSSNVEVLGNIVTMNGSYNVLNTSLGGGQFIIGAGLTANSSTFTQHNGTLTGDGSMVVTGTLTWTYGAMLGAGVTRANGGLVLSGNNVRFLNGRILENNGTALFQEGSITASNGAIITNLAGATFDFQADVALNVAPGGGTFNNQGTVTKSAGSGTATIATAFTNSGAVTVQSGDLHFGGNFTQTASGTLFVQIGGLIPITEFDQFNINGNATLDGTLDVSLSNAFIPNPGDSFNVMTFSSHTGQFAHINGNGQSYNVNYNASDVTLVAQ